MAQQWDYRFWIDNIDNVTEGTFSSTEVSTVADLSTFSAGPHIISYMVKDSRGNWSAPHTRAIIKLPPALPAATPASIEYWIDSPSRKVNASLSGETFTTDMNLADLSAGVHFLTYRVCDSRGNWSAPSTSLIVKETATSPGLITAYQYWFNDSKSDISTVTLPTPVSPFNLTTTLTIPADEISKQTSDVCVTLDENGKSHIGYNQILNMRFRDSDGEWSANDTYPFTVSANESHIDLSGLIINHDASLNSKGWTFKGSCLTSQKGAHYSDPNHNYFTLGNKKSARWSGSMTQTIENLPAGTYIISVATRASLMTSAKLTVNNESVDLPSEGMTKGDIWSAAADTTYERRANNGDGFGWSRTAIAVVTQGDPLSITISAEATETDQWIDITDFNLSTDRMASLRIEYAPTIDPAAYDGCKLQLSSESTSSSITTTSRRDYIFSGVALDVPYSLTLLNRYGQALWSKNDIVTSDQAKTITIDSIAPTQTVSLEVVTPEGNKATDHATITWADRDGKYLASGAKVDGMSIGSEVTYKIALSDSLGCVYKVPEAKPLVVSESTASVICKLEQLPTAVLSGRIYADTYPAYNAQVTVTQNIGGKYQRTSQTITDDNGRLSIELPDDSCDVTVTYTGFMNASVALSHPSDMGNVRMKPITGGIVAIDLRNIPLSESTEVADTIYWNGAVTDFDYKICNLTTGTDSIAYVMQGKSLISEEINSGDRLAIYATNRADDYDDVVANVTTDIDRRAVARITVTDRGAIEAHIPSSANQNNTALLFDEGGKYVTKASFSNSGKVRFTGLPQAGYSIVAMGHSDLMGMTSNLDALADAGLKEGVDYVMTDVSVRNALTTQVELPAIPRLNESALYYTTPLSSFSANKSQAVTGNYVTFTANLELKPEFNNQIDNMELVVEIPDGCDYIYNSGIIGSELATIHFEENSVVIPLTRENYRNRIRFCITPTHSGEFLTHGYLRFAHSGKTIVQPLGRIALDVDELGINVPILAIEPQFSASGTAMPNSEVSLFDRDVLLGKTNSKADGSWNVTTNLVDPINNTVHPIHAEILTANGSVLKTATKEMEFNRQGNRVKTVTMINTAHGASSLKPKEYVCTFNFINPMDEAEVYWYWPEYPKFTFIVDFLSNNPERVSNVIVKVKTVSGDIVPLRATYNQEKDRWIATGKFTTYTKPVNVSVAYDTNDPLPLLDDKLIDEGFNAISSISTEFDSIESDYETEMKLFEDFIKQHPSGGNLDMLKEYFASHGRSDIFDYEYDDNIELPAEFNEILAQISDGTDPDTLVSLVSDYSRLISDKLSPYMYLLEDMDKLRKMPQGVPYNLPNGYSLSIAKSIDPQYLEPTVSESLVVVDLKSVHGKKVTVIYTPNSYIIGDRTTSTYYILHMPTSRGNINSYSIYGNNNTPYSSAGDWINIGIGSTLLLINGSIEFCKEVIPVLYKSIKPIKNLTPALFDLLGTFWSYKDSLRKLEQISKFLTGVGVAIDVEQLISDANQDEIEHEKIIKELTDILQHAIDCELNDYIPELQENINYISNCHGGYCTLKLLKNMGMTAVSALAKVDKRINLAILAWQTLDAIFGVGDRIDRSVSEYFDDKIKELDDSIPWDQCKDDDDEPEDEPEDDKPKKEEDSGNKDKSGVDDPSGYVYEAVSSNRLPGVTATIYELTNITDIYGDMSQSALIWNAAPYSQRNPVTTDENGRYAWDVPAGQWQVRFSKPGYEPAATKWLPVPPPQLDINIPMTQAVNPQVDGAVGYESGITFTFSKYMKPSSIADSCICVLRTATGSVPGHLEFVNLEMDKVSGKSFASKVKFVPSQPFTVGETVKARVEARVESYADMPMLESFEAEIVIQPELKSIEVDSVVTVPIGTTKTLDLIVSPAATAAGRKVTVYNGSPSIAAVTPAVTTLDADGHASINITGTLPGDTPVLFTIDGSDLATETMVTVGLDVTKVSAPTSSIPTGCIVPAGTSVALYCATDGARIYYTTDGSCPCDNGTRHLYTAPILIDHTMTIKAMAEKEGAKDSKVMSFEYIVGTSDISEVLQSSTKVTTENGEIIVRDCHNTHCSIYDSAGRVMWNSRHLNGDIRIRLQPNMTYVVHLIETDGSATVNHLLLK